MLTSINDLLHGFGTSSRVDAVGLRGILRLGNYLVDLDRASSGSWLDDRLLVSTARLNLSLGASLSDSLDHGNNFLILILLDL